MRFSGAIFDLDGTLLDSMPMWRGLGERYLNACGVCPPKDINERISKMSLAEAAEYFREEYGIEKSAEEIAEEVNASVRSEYENNLKLKSGAAEFLERLRRQNVVMCVATATDGILARAALERTGVAMFFKGIISCKDVGEGKTKPKIYEAAREILGTPKEKTIVFEDAYHAAQTAVNAGFALAAVYDKSEPEQSGLRGIADYYIEDFGGAEAESIVRTR